ncbi:hypothetical protein JCM31447_04340 [Fluviispira sanaruensis]|uniref:Uncharacterized protein n=1 Tax=Fluviispira sanaruensis TaxID=2493639 RepID=A0A4V0P250_FLUSA|nr:hypothetical protein JCM31447_04340 [Fluviispira sanaruensis]
MTHAPIPCANHDAKIAFVFRASKLFDVTINASRTPQKSAKKIIFYIRRAN